MCTGAEPAILEAGFGLDTGFGLMTASQLSAGMAAGLASGAGVALSGATGPGVLDTFKAVSPFVSAASSALQLGAASRLGRQPFAAPPTVFGPSTMPVPDDEAARRLRERAIAQMVAQRGRASTILTQPSGDGDLLGQ